MANFRESNQPYTPSNIDNYLKQKTEYAAAIQAYKNQKKRMLKAYSIETQKTVKESSQDFKQYLFNNVQGDKATPQTYSFIKTYVSEVMSVLLNKKNTNALSKGKKDTLENQNLTIKKANELFANIVAQIYNDDAIRNFIVKNLQTNNLHSVDITDIFNSLKYYRTQIAKTFATGKISNAEEFQLYAKPLNSLKGYIKEVAIHDAFQEFFSTHTNNAFASAMVGSQNTEVDEIINYLNFSGKMKGTAKADSFTFGVQVKSWVLSDTNKYKNYDIGNRAELLTNAVAIDQDNKHSWVESTAYLGRKDNILKAIGKQNILYATNNELYWTADLIKHMRDAGTYIAFEFQKDKSNYVATEHLSWQHIRTRLELKKII